MNIQILNEKSFDSKKQSGIFKSGGLNRPIYRYEGKRAQQRRI